MDHSEVKHFPKVDHTPNDLDEASRLLMTAADLIERVGLWQPGRASNSPRMGTCLILSVDSSSSGDRKLRDSAIGRVAVNLGFDPNDIASVARWNDERERTKDHVVSKLRAVALGL